MRRLRSFLLGAALVGPVASARADEVDILGARLVSLEAAIRELDIELKPPEQTPEAITRRLIDGQVLYELKNYEAASTVFLDIVEKYPKSPEFPEALFYLADSLYLKRDFLSARRYYERTIELPRPRHAQETLERLIEIALHSGDYSKVDSYLARLGQIEGAPGPQSAVPYVKGKYFFFRKRYEDALSTLQSIPKGHPSWYQAQYFIGASLVGQQRFGEAVQVFDNLAKSEPKADPKADVEKKVVELAHMALGRIYYDQGQLQSATAEYGKIAQDSDQFADALYESAWVAVKEKLYQKAYRQFDLMLTTQSEGPQVPEIKLLMGNLQIRNSEFDEATKSFEKTRDQFEVVKKDIDAVAQKQGNPVAYFKGVLVKNTGRFDLSAALPPSAVKWISKDPDLDKLTSVMGDLGDVTKAVSDSETTIARIEKQLDDPTRVNIFPELAQARTRSLETGNQLIDVENKLLTIERKLIDPVIDAERQQLDDLARQRQQLEKQLENLPREKDSYQDRIRKARAAFDELDKRAVEINVALQSAVAKRVAIERYFHDSGQDRMPEKSAAVEAQLAEAKQIEAQLVAEQERLRRDIADASNAVGVDDAQMRQEEDLKRKLAEVMAREHEVFEQSRARLDGRSRSKTDQIESLLTRARTGEEAIKGFNVRIDALIDQRLTDVRAMLSEEKGNFSRYKVTLASYNGESGDIGGGVLATSFKNVQERFYQIVVRADVGIIDVAWALKQNKTDENSRLVREKKRDLKVLDDEFREVLKE